MTDQTPEVANVNPERWTAFEQFEAEYASGSHRRMAAAWNEELFKHFQPAEKYRTEMAVALQCVRHLEQLRTEYRQKKWQRVVDIYEAQREHFDTCSDYLTGYKPHVEEAFKQITMLFRLRFQTALEQNDDEALEKVLTERAPGYTSAAMLDHFERLQVLSADDRKRAALALERLMVIRQIRSYLERVDAQDKALTLYEENEHSLRLADSKALTKSDRSGLYEARRAHTRDALREAVIRGDDDQILLAASAAMAVGWALPDGTLDRVRQAAERKAARERVAQANNERDLIIAYDAEVLATDRQFDPDKREEIENARRVYKPLLALRRAIKRNELRAVANLVNDPVQARELVKHLEPSERIVVERVQEGVRVLPELTAALAIRPRTEPALAQIAALSGTPETTKTFELLLPAFEKKQLRNALDTYEAIDELNRLAQAPEMAWIKLATAQTYKKATAAGVVLPDTLNWTKIRAALDFQERWSALTVAIEAGDERAIFEAWNPNYLHEGLDLLSDKDKVVLLTALQNTSRNERIASALASDDAKRVAFVQRELSTPVDN